MEFREHISDVPVDAAPAVDQAIVEATVEPERSDVSQQEAEELVSSVQSLAEVLEAEEIEPPEAPAEVVEPTIVAAGMAKCRRIVSEQTDAEDASAAGDAPIAASEDEPSKEEKEESDAEPEAKPPITDKQPPVEEMPSLQPAQGSGGGQQPPTELPPTGGEDDDDRPEPESEQYESSQKKSVGEVTEVKKAPSETATPTFNRLLEKVETFNSQPERGATMVDALVGIAKERKAVQELIEAGLDEEEARENVAAIEGAEAEEKLLDARLTLDLFKMQHAEELEELGLDVSPETEDYALLVIGDGERFAGALAEVDEGALDDNARERLEGTAEHVVHTITGWTLDKHEETLQSRYRDALAGIDLFYGQSADELQQAHITEEALGKVEAYGPEMRRLDLKPNAVNVLETMEAARQDGMMPEAALLQEVGVLYLDDNELGNKYAGSWGPDPADWRLVDEIVDHITLPGQPTAFRSHMAWHIPALLDRKRAEALEVSITPEDDEFDLPEEVYGPDEASAAFFARKRDEYRAKLEL